MELGREGRPVDVKAIACDLNERGVLRRGHLFSIGSVHDILTSTTYYGVNYFNRRNARDATARPPSQWIALQVPPIIDEETFNTVPGLLQSRSPRRVPPGVVNGPTLLAGIARCAYCGAALIENTGKGGAYRNYRCARKLKRGVTACRGMRMRMERPNDIVVGEVAKCILEPGTACRRTSPRSRRRKSSSSPCYCGTSWTVARRSCAKPMRRWP
jgi:hypothetical protein